MKHSKLVLTFLFIVLFLTTARTISAAVFTVTNTNDSGAGSLRQAILDANNTSADDEIAFDSSVFNQPRTIVLTGGEISVGLINQYSIAQSLTINGSAADLLTISGNNQSRVFHLERYASAVFNNLKITAGNGAGSLFNGSGGAILAEGGASLLITNSILSGNNVPSSGGAIYSGSARVKIINSLIAGNKAIFGGGINQRGSNLDILNSTISGNTASSGGGIYNLGSFVTLTNCTVAFNASTSEYALGGGVYLDYYMYSGNSTLSARNTIIAKNTSGSNKQPDIGGSGVISLGHNIFGSEVNVYEDTTTNQVNTDPQIDPVLRSNGGIIPTHALSAASPAIDRGNNCVLTAAAAGGCIDQSISTDQRGVSRPQDGDDDGNRTVDIGAFEVTPAEVSLSPKTPDLQAANDTGASASDNITSSRDLSFDLSGVTSGATVEFFRSGVKIAETVAGGNTVTFNDADVPLAGTFVYSARQTVNNVVSLFSGSLSVTVDTNAPTVAVNQANGQADPTNGQTISFSVVFSEPVTGFSTADISLKDSTANVSAANIAVAGSGAAYTVTIGNITGDGSVIAAVLPNTAQDLAGNTNTASTSADNVVNVDRTAPTVTINQVATQADPTRNMPVNFTVVFSEPVTGFTITDISFVGSTANVSSAFVSVTGSGTTYNVSVSGVTSNGGFLQANVVSQAAADAAGNPSATSTSGDNRITIDNTAPTVTIDQAVGQADPTAALPINFTVVFSEPVTGFDAADISLSGSSINTTSAVITVTGSGTTYNIAVSNIVSNGGFVRAGIRSSAASDALGNFNFNFTTSDNLVVVDNVAPAVSINQATGQIDPTTTQPVSFIIVFSEQVTGFDSTDVSLAGSTANVSSAQITVTGSGSVYTVRISNITSSGQVRASIASGSAKDAVGNLSIASTGTDNTITVNIKTTLFDFDGDGQADVSVFRPSNGTWYLSNSKSGFSSAQFGLPTDKIVLADYDGDGRTDIAVWRENPDNPDRANFYILNSKDGTVRVEQFGRTGDSPIAVADYDGDGKADPAVYRAGTNGGQSFFFYKPSTRPTVDFVSAAWGIGEDKPVVADYDGDGKADVAVFRPSNGIWYIAKSGGGFSFVQFGSTTDKPVVGDYDGDGKADQAVYRPENGTWYILQSNRGFTAAQFGVATDLPVPADYDGDGRTDIAVFRPAGGNWYISRSNLGFSSIQFGTAGDKPAPNAFVP